MKAPLTALITLAFTLTVLIACLGESSALAFIGNDVLSLDTSFVQPDVYPTVLNGVNRQPIIPDRAVRENVSGKVSVVLLVDTLGEVKELERINESPQGYGFGEAVEKVIFDWRFHPATKAGRPIQCWIAISFKLDPKDELRNPIPNSDSLVCGYGSNNIDPVPIDENCPQPDYPKKALQDGIEGRVVVQLHVDSTGHVSACNIIQERPKDYGFRQAAEQAFPKWQFTPAYLNGVPTDKWITFPFTFRLPK